VCYIFNYWAHIQIQIHNLSFCAGGYIAGKKELIDYIRIHSHANCYGATMSAAVTQQVISSLRIIMGYDGNDEGKKRIERLAWNSHYFRQHLVKMGFIIYGNWTFFQFLKLLGFNEKIKLNSFWSLKDALAFSN
jgi:7-keto-8-aminopelargonate synthetase-like enzyme